MGAWDHYYRKGSHADAGSPYGYGILAVKRELVYLGASGLDLGSLVIGNAASDAITAFQRSHGLQADGVVGPQTGRALFKPRVVTLEQAYQLPPATACRIVAQESAFDPGAVNEASADFGIVQIHAASHPTITIAEAFDPAYALDYLCHSLATTYVKLQDWQCAIAAWHVGGGGADVWCGFGKPAHGGPTWSPNLFAEATTYIADVEGQTC